MVRFCPCFMDAGNALISFLSVSIFFLVCVYLTWGLAAKVSPTLLLMYLNQFPLHLLSLKRHESVALLLSTVFVMILCLSLSCLTTSAFGPSLTDFSITKLLPFCWHFSTMCSWIQLWWNCQWEITYCWVLSYFLCSINWLHSAYISTYIYNFIHRNKLHENWKLWFVSCSNKTPPPAPVVFLVWLFLFFFPLIFFLFLKIF